MIDCSEHIVEIQRLNIRITEAREKADWREVAELAGAIEWHAASMQVIAWQERRKAAAEAAA